MITRLMVCALFFSAFSLVGQMSLAFPMQGIVHVTPNEVSVQFCNEACDYVLTCQAQATGWLNTGYPISAGGMLSLPPGQCAYAYVYANYPFYFVNGQGMANCQ